MTIAQDGKDRRLRCWDVATGAELPAGRLESRSLPTGRIDWSPSGRRLLISGRAIEIRRLD